MKTAKMIAIILTLCIFCIPIGSQFAYASEVSTINESVMCEEKRICGATKRQARNWSTVGGVEMCLDCEYMIG